MHDLISVIIPVYKVEKYLCRCVDSVLEQTYTNMEIILVDDGSPDNCPIMCDEDTARPIRTKNIQFVFSYNKPKMAKSKMVPRIYPIATWAKLKATAPIPMIQA